MHSKFKMVVIVGLSFLFFSTFMVMGTSAAPQTEPGGTTITVDTTNDELNTDGDCSLREAIQAANSDTAVDACPAGNGDDTILLSSGTYALALEGEDDTNSTGDFDILDNLTINGQGAGETILDGNQINRLIHVVNVSTNVELNDVTITNGDASDTPNRYGGGIYNFGSMQLNAITMIGNTGIGGGGIINLGTLTLTNSSLISNRATLFAGGGIWNAVYTGTTVILTINDSLISGNMAPGIPGNVNSGFGGGIGNLPFANVTSGTGVVNINNSTISNNQALNGGGIGNALGLAERFVDMRVTVNRSTISGNTATGDDILLGNGGGIANTDSYLTVVNSTLSGNAATGTGSASSGLGGGIINGSFGLAASSATLINSTISDGNAVAGGGVANVVFAGDESLTITFKNSLVAGNSASSCFNQDGTFTSLGHNLEDGNLCNFDQATDLIDSDPMLGPLAENGGATLTHALLADSPAIDAADNEVCSTAPVNAQDQRGIERPRGDTCDIGAYELEQDVTSITVNTTNDELNTDGDCSLREAIQAANSDTAVDACPAGNGDDTILLSSGTYALALEGEDDTNSTGDFDILDNLTINGQGTGETILDGNQIHRLIHVVNVSTNVELNDVTITNGNAINAQINHGGGVFNWGSTVMNNVDILDSIGVSGGGIINVGELTLTNSSLISNTAILGGGGAIWNAVYTGTTVILTINDSLISGNTVPGTPGDVNSSFGGGIANLPIAGATNGTGEVYINNSTISNNQALNGGGIGNALGFAGEFVDMHVTVNRSTISGNTATGEGLLMGNGGGIANTDSTLTVVNSTLSGNAATGTGSPFSGLGGGILNGTFTLPTSAASATFINSTISGGNAAAGGAIASVVFGDSTDLTTTFKNSLVAGNSAALAPSCFNKEGTLTSQGHNLEDSNLCNFDQATDLIDSDPMLGPLAENGGATSTHALLADSPAIDAADNEVCSTAPVNGQDQRGIERPQGSTCDIGAYELEQDVTSITLATFDGKSPTSWSPIGVALFLLFTVGSGLFGRHLYRSS